MTINHQIIQVQIIQKNKKLIIEKEKNDSLKQEEVNNNLNNIMKYLSDNLKAQSEENKSMFEKIVQDNKNSLKNDKELLQNIKEVNEKNSELTLNNNILNNKIKTLEEQNQ